GASGAGTHRSAARGSAGMSIRPLLSSAWTEWLIALRFLLDNRMQTLLILFGITVGSAVIVFITAIITGLQSNVVDRTLGTQAHIRVLPLDEFNRLAPLPAGTLSLLRESRRPERRGGARSVHPCASPGAAAARIQPSGAVARRHPVAAARESAGPAAALDQQLAGCGDPARPAPAADRRVTGGQWAGAGPER